MVYSNMIGPNHVFETGDAFFIGNAFTSVTDSVV